MIQHIATNEPPESERREVDRRETDGAAAFNWKTLMAVATLLALSSGVFAAGMAWAGVNQNATGLSDLKSNVVMKDGKEMEELRGQLRMINYQLSVLVTQGRAK